MKYSIFIGKFKKSRKIFQKILIVGLIDLAFWAYLSCQTKSIHCVKQNPSLANTCAPALPSSLVATSPVWLLTLEMWLVL